MDIIKKLPQYATDIFSDLKLTLEDATAQITIDVHKIILYRACVYFEKLLTSFREKDLEEFTIGVPNAYVCYDIIMGFYGVDTNCGDLEKWKHALVRIKCYDFFGIEQKFNYFENIIVPVDGLPLLFDTIEIADYPIEMVKQLAHSVPDNYGLDGLDKKLIMKMEKIKYGRFATAGYDRSIRICNSETGEYIDVVHSHSDRINAIAYSSHDMILSGGDDCRVVVSDSVTSYELDSFKSENGRIYCVAFSPCGKRTASGTSQGFIIIYTLASHKKINIAAHPDGCQSIVFSPDNKTIISGGDNGCIKIWNSDSYEMIASFVDHTKAVLSLGISIDNKKLVSGSSDKTIKIWNLENIGPDQSSKPTTLVGHQNIIGSVQFSSDQKNIISISNDDTIKFWNVENGELIKTLTNYGDFDTTNIAISPDNDKIIAPYGTDGDIMIHDITNNNKNKPVCISTGHNGFIRCIAYRPSYKKH